MRRFLRSLPLLLAAGIGGTVLIAWGSLALVDLSTLAPTRTTQSYDGHVQWNVGMAYAAAAVRITARREMGLSWCVDQACGAPNSHGGDDPAAWASEAADGTTEWLELEYDAPIVPAGIQIHENFNPGAVVKVTIFDASTGEAEVVRRGSPQIVSPTPNMPTVVRRFDLPIHTQRQTRRIRLDLDSAAVPGWNEIDAVGLVDPSGGGVAWAAEARASTTYRGGKDGDNAAVRDIPAWAQIPLPPARINASRQQVPPMPYDIEGRGWPMAALRVQMPDPALPQTRTIRPIWRGIVVDSLVFAVIFALLRWLAVYPKRFIVESSRLRRGRCMLCGYDLQYNFPAGCPECGWRRGPMEKAPTQQETRT